jgi:hypothetical protein
MAENTTVTIETGFEVDAEIPNRVARTASIETAAEFDVAIAPEQETSVSGGARQSTMTSTVRPAIPPAETVVFSNYEIYLDESGINYFSWDTNEPLSTCWRYRKQGEEEWIVIPAPDPPTLTTDHFAELFFDEFDVVYEYQPYGVDILSIEHYGDIDLLIMHHGGGGHGGGSDGTVERYVPE